MSPQLGTAYKTIQFNKVEKTIEIDAFDLWSFGQRYRMHFIYIALNTFNFVLLLVPPS